MEQNKDLDFLYYVCEGMSKPSLNYWISIPDFTNQIRHLQSHNVAIDKQVVLELMREIYFTQENEKRINPGKHDFNFQTARRAIKTLWESITGTREGWRGE